MCLLKDHSHVLALDETRGFVGHLWVKPEDLWVITHQTTSYSSIPVLFTWRKSHFWPYNSLLYQLPWLQYYNPRISFTEQSTKSKPSPFTVMRIACLISLHQSTCVQRAQKGPKKLWLAMNAILSSIKCLANPDHAFYLHTEYMTAPVVSCFIDLKHIST